MKPVLARGAARREWGMGMFLMPLTFTEKREESVVGVFLFLFQFSRVIRIPFCRGGGIAPPVSQRHRCGTHRC